MENQYQTQPCASGCGRAASKSKHGLCATCAEVARKERWRAQNPTFREMVEMNETRLEEILNRLFFARAEKLTNSPAPALQDGDPG